MSQEHHSLEDFRGTARLFPLPNLVLFPHVAQPLHIFEPRYRQMMADALDDDRLLAMALLQPGWEEDYHQKPPIHPMVCVGRIAQEELLADGRYNLLLQGLCRARIIEELTSPKLYRTAQVELCPDRPVTSPGLQQSLRRDLGQGVIPFFTANGPALDQLKRLMESHLPLGSLCDIFCFALPLDLEQKQQLLETVCVEKRIRLLLRELEGKILPPPKEVSRRAFPPEFSDN